MKSFWCQYMKKTLTWELQRRSLRNLGSTTERWQARRCVAVLRRLSLPVDSSCRWQRWVRSRGSRQCTRWWPDTTVRKHDNSVLRNEEEIDQWKTTLTFAPHTSAKWIRGSSFTQNLRRGSPSANGLSGFAGCAVLPFKNNKQHLLNIFRASVKKSNTSMTNLARCHVQYHQANTHVRQSCRRCTSKTAASQAWLLGGNPAKPRHE